MQSSNTTALWAIIADMSPRIIHIPLSGGDRKAQAKGIRFGSGGTAIAFVFPKSLQPRVSQFVRAGM